MRDGDKKWRLKKSTDTRSPIVAAVAGILEGKTVRDSDTSLSAEDFQQLMQAIGREETASALEGPLQAAMLDSSEKIGFGDEVAVVAPVPSAPPLPEVPHTCSGVGGFSVVATEAQDDPEGCTALATSEPSEVLASAALLLVVPPAIAPIMKEKLFAVLSYKAPLQALSARWQMLGLILCDALAFDQADVLANPKDHLIRAVFVALQLHALYRWLTVPSPERGEAPIPQPVLNAILQTVLTHWRTHPFLLLELARGPVTLTDIISKRRSKETEGWLATFPAVLERYLQKTDYFTRMKRIRREFEIAKRQIVVRRHEYCFITQESLDD